MTLPIGVGAASSQTAMAAMSSSSSSSSSSTLLAANPAGVPRVEQANVQASLVGHRHWLTAVARLLGPLHLSSIAKEMTIEELLVFLRLKIYDRPEVSNFIDENTTDVCLVLERQFHYDLFDECALDNLNDFLKALEGRRNKNAIDACKELKNALLFIIRSPATKSLVKKKLSDLFEPQELSKLFCKEEQETQRQLESFSAYHHFLCRTLDDHKKDLLAINDVWKNGHKDEYDHLQTFLRTFQKHEKELRQIGSDIKKILLLQPYLLPGLLLSLLSSYEKSLNQLKNMLAIEFRFIKKRSKNTLDTSSQYDESVVQLMQMRGHDAQLINILMQDEEDIDPKVLTSTACNEEATEKLFKALLDLDQLRVSVAKHYVDNNQVLKEQFMQKIARVQVNKSQVLSKKNSSKVHQVFEQKCDTMKEAAPILDRLCKSIKVHSHGLKIPDSLITMLKNRYGKIAIDREALALKATEALLSEEQKLTTSLPDRTSSIEDMDEDVTEEVEDQKPSTMAQVPPVVIPVTTGWQGIQNCLLHLKTLEKWRAPTTSPKMVERSKICMRQASLHFSSLQSQVILMKRAQAENRVQLLPLFSQMLARSGSLVTEQLVSAYISMREDVQELTHYHVTLAEQAKFPKNDSSPWDLFYKLNGGEISHRYPYQFANRCDKMHFKMPLALQMMINPQSFGHLYQLAVEVLDFVSLFLTDKASGKELFVEVAPKNRPSLFSDTFEKELKPAVENLDACKSKIEALISRSGGNVHPLWLDARKQIENMQLLVHSLSLYPQANTLFSLGDLLFTQAQFLHELIENGLFYMREGYLLDSHNLEVFRVVNNHECSEEQAKLLASMNAEYGAHYPYLYRANHNEIPLAVSWRLDALKYANSTKEIDQEAVDCERERSAGFQVIQYGKPAGQPHTLTTLHNDLIRSINGMTLLCRQRVERL